MKKWISVLVLTVACSNSKEKELFLQSVETHELAIKIGLLVEKKISRIETQVEELDEQLKQQLLDSVKVLKVDLNDWKETIVEIPGHEHDHADHHDHHKGAPLNLTPEMILEIQKDLRERIVKLNIRAQNILEILNKENNNEPVEEKEKASSYGA